MPQETQNENQEQILEKILANYKRKEDRALIERAYHFAAEAHKGQLRKTGEPYIFHPLIAAQTVAELRLDPSTIAAALLHDTIEDTGTSRETIAKEFGEQVAFLVEGVTKLGKVKYEEGGRGAENLRKMLLAMAEDIRVVLIKCADRLHNMQTLQVLSPEIQMQKAIETMEIYAPIASRLGIWEIANTLQDLAFPYIHPGEYAYIKEEVRRRFPEREEFLKKIRPELTEALKAGGIKPIEIQTRSKHLYSLYKKLQKYEQNWGMIHDLVASRIIVKNIEECYAVLGIIHKLWRPYPGRIKDYIAMPKTNGYQSLHTTVFCEDNVTTEFQIRTLEMHEKAERGIAAHWAYDEKGKESEKTADVGRGTFSWVSQIRQWQQEMPETEEFFEAMKIDLFEDRIFVLTPRGQVIDLPESATPVDFAYAIHSKLGNACNGARVNGKYVPLNHELKSGDVIEIDKVSGRGPSPDWLEFVKTSQARSHIRVWFKKENKEQNAARGLELLNRELKECGSVAFQAIAEDKRKSAFARFGYKTAEDFLASVGSGEISLPRALRNLIDEKEAMLVAAPPTFKRTDFSPVEAIKISGQTGLKTHLAQCCSPVPGENIRAYMTVLGSASVHKENCVSLDANRKSFPGRIFPAQWQNMAGTQGVPITLAIHSQDRVGLLQDIASTISGLGINMRSLNAETPETAEAVMTATVEVTSFEELQRIIKKIKTVRGVEEIRRV